MFNTFSSILILWIVSGFVSFYLINHLIGKFRHLSTLIIVLILSLLCGLLGLAIVLIIGAILNFVDFFRLFFPKIAKRIKDHFLVPPLNDEYWDGKS